MKQTFSLSKNSVWRSKDFLYSVAVSLFLLFLSFFANYFAGTYANMRQSNSVSDILLDNLPVFDVDAIFLDGFFLFWVVVTAIILYRPKTIPFVVKSIALFILVRSVFITLTHIAEFPLRAPVSSDGLISSLFTFGGDLFFSAHTGLPFLMALVYWKIKNLRFFFLIASIFFATIVILGHLHYSIDVFSAFFITDSIFRIAKKFFKKDYQNSNLAV